MIQFIDLLETILALDALCRSSFNFVHKDDAYKDCFQNNMRLLMLQIKTFVPREEGNGWNLQKFHELLHLAKNIDSYGSPLNFDAGIEEKGLKDWVKQHTRTVQHRDVHTYNSQLATRVYDSETVHKATVLTDTTGNAIKTNLDNKISDNDSNIENQDDQQEEPERRIKTMNHHLYYFTWDPINETAICHNNKKTKTNINIYVSNVTKNHFTKMYLKVDDEEERSKTRFLCYTEISLGPVRLRAHPRFRGQPWYDYCVVNWGPGYGDIPGKILCFFEKETKGEIQTLNEITQDTIRVLLHSCFKHNMSQRQQKKMKLINTISQYWPMETNTTTNNNNKEPRINQIVASNIQDGAFVLDKNRNTQENYKECPHVWMINPRQEWINKFIQQIE